MKKQIDKKTERTEWEKIKYESVKYLAFVAPPAAIYLICYYFTQSFVLAAAITFVVVISAVIGIAAWYYKRTRVMP